MVKLTSTDGQVFGGVWTEIKLNCIEKYLQAYMTIFRKSLKAIIFKTFYIDGFAGSGTWCPPGIKKQEELILYNDQKSVMDGSARKALSLTYPFDHYLFIESNDHCINNLQGLKIEFPPLADRVEVVKGDANMIITNFCKGFNRNHRERAVMFLDPFGMEVDWSTIGAVGDTKAIDMWLLFPVGVAIIRLLRKKDLPSDAWTKRLDTTFGTNQWQNRFYSSITEETLFGAEERSVREANWQSVSLFMIERLKSKFTYVTETPLVLRNSTSSPMYILCFASQNEKGHKIAQDIINKQIKDQKYVN